MIRVIASMTTLLSGATLLCAQTVCTRSMLRAATESYIAAQETGDPSRMSLALKAKYVENMQDAMKDKGIWNNALPIAFHRSIYDVGRCMTFTEVIVTEGGHPYVIGTRLKVNDGRVTKIDSLVTDEGDWLFDAANYLKYSKTEDWDILPVDERVSRQDLIDAGNQYFDAVFTDKLVRAPWGIPCARLEGGAYTNPKNDPHATCEVDIPGGSLFIVNRSYVVDEEMGAINVFCRFGGSDGMPDSHTFRLVDGRYRFVHTLSVNLTGKPIEIPQVQSEE